MLVSMMATPSEFWQLVFSQAQIWVFSSLSHPTTSSSWYWFPREHCELFPAGIHALSWFCWSVEASSIAITHCNPWPLHHSLQLCFPAVPVMWAMHEPFQFCFIPFSFFSVTLARVACRTSSVPLSHTWKFLLVQSSMLVSMMAAPSESWQLGVASLQLLYQDFTQLSLSADGSEWLREICCTWSSTVSSSSATTPTTIAWKPRMIAVKTQMCPEQQTTW